MRTAKGRIDVTYLCLFRSQNESFENCAVNSNNHDNNRRENGNVKAEHEERKKKIWSDAKHKNQMGWV